MKWKNLCTFFGNLTPALEKCLKCLPVSVCRYVFTKVHLRFSKQLELFCFRNYNYSRFIELSIKFPSSFEGREKTGIIWKLMNENMKIQYRVKEFIVTLSRIDCKNVRCHAFR